MSKRYRFVLILVVMTLCFIFLLPSIRWYFWVPKLDQTRALQSREQIKSYSIQAAQTDLEKLIPLARNGGDMPADMDFLTAQARRIYRDVKRPAPEAWNARAVLGAFASRQEALGAIEANYGDKIFALKRLQNNAVQLGLDLSGGLSIVLEADMEALRERQNGRVLTALEQEDAVNRALEVLNSRIDRFGLTEPVIRRQGADRIYVEIPGTADPERINSIIMGKGSLAFHIVDEEATLTFNTQYNANPGHAWFNAQGELLDPSIVPSDVVIRPVYIKDRYGLDEQARNAQGNPDYVAIKRDIGLDGNHIQSAEVNRNSQNTSPTVSFVLDSEGGEIFYRLTSANVGKPMAIVLEDRVKSQAVIRAGIRTSGSIEGFAAEEANNIALTLRTAALPVELRVLNQMQIGASMGEDTIRQGLYALSGGLALVLVFMLLFYKGAGINAIIAQILNLYFMFSILSAFNFTLTLPSIAGFILTIGMAVDANVLIFERMKEELRLGKGRKAAIDAGFDKAFWAIMDSNITTFIAALFLSQMGSGPIQGFAVSLAIGLFSSVFTALFVSRLIFDFGTDVLGSKHLSVSWRTK